MAGKGGDDEGTINVASRKVGKGNKSNGPIKLKKAVPKQTKPGNWRDGSVADDDKKSKRSESPAVKDKDKENVSLASPLVNIIDDAARETFATGRPLEDSLNLQQCKHCKKGIIKTAAKTHIAQCLKIKKEKAQRKKEAREARERAKEQAREEEARKNDPDGDTKMNDDSDDDDDNPEKKDKASKKVGGKKPDGEPKGKKRKADGDGDKGPKSKKKKEEKPKAPKPKGPVDVEKQCGVPLANGQPCARSLTCKSHSMGAKRAVAGRSLPYDMLLSQYQKKNQAKQQKAALNANAPIEDEDEATGPVDSDEETAAVMAALSKWNPQPVIAPPVFAPIKRTYQMARLFEQLQTATNGGRNNIFAVSGLGSQKTPGRTTEPMNVDQDNAPGGDDANMNASGAASKASSFKLAQQAASRRPSAVANGT